MKLENILKQLTKVENTILLTAKVPESTAKALERIQAECSTTRTSLVAAVLKEFVAEYDGHFQTYDTPEVKKKKK